MQRCGGHQKAKQRLGIMRGDDPAGEGDVGQVLAESVKIGVGQVGDSG